MRKNIFHRKVIHPKGKKSDQQTKQQITVEKVTYVGGNSSQQTTMPLNKDIIKSEWP